MLALVNCTTYVGTIWTIERFERMDDWVKRAVEFGKFAALPVYSYGKIIWKP